MAPAVTDLAVSARAWRLLTGLVLVAGAVGLAVWYAHHPAPLPTEDRTVTASTPVEVPVYVGVANGATGRTLDLSGVKVRTTSNTELSVTPLLCRNGRVEATSDPAAFCEDVVNPEGEALTERDSIMVRIVSDVPAVAVVDPVRLGFREDLQWGTLPTGAGAVVRVLAR